MFNRKRAFLFAAAILAAIIGTAATGKACGPRHERHAGMHQRLLEEITEDLELTDAQQASLEALRSESEELRSEGGGERQAVHDAIRTELETEEPDLRKIVELTRVKIDEGSSLRQELIEAHLSFYETLTPEQKRQVAAKMSEHMERMEKMRGGFKGRSEGHFGYRGF